MTGLGQQTTESDWRVSAIDLHQPGFQRNSSLTMNDRFQGTVFALVTALPHDPCEPLADLFVVESWSALGWPKRSTRRIRNSDSPRRPRGASFPHRRRPGLRIAQGTP